MSPVSCLVRFPASEKQKKRVRFNIDIYPVEGSRLGFDGDIYKTAPLPVPMLSTLADPLSADHMSSLSSVTTDVALHCSTTDGAWQDHNNTQIRSSTGTIQRNDVRPRWWRRKVSSLGVASPPTVVPSMSCQDAIDVMRQQGCSQLPVVHQAGELCGVVTLKGLLTALVVQRAQPTSPVSQVVECQYETVSRDDTLGTLSELLEETDFALVVRVQRRLSETREVAAKEVLIGVITRMDLLTHVVDQCAA